MRKARPIVRGLAFYSIAELLIDCLITHLWQVAPNAYFMAQLREYGSRLKNPVTAEPGAEGEAMITQIQMEDLKVMIIRSMIRIRIIMRRIMVITLVLIISSRLTPDGGLESEGINSDDAIACGHEQW